MHDIAKPLTTAEMVDICQKAKDPVTPEELAREKVIHAKAGAIIARDEFGITDQEILDAIRYHTTGRPGMTMLEKIIFIADIIIVKSIPPFWIRGYFKNTHFIIGDFKLSPIPKAL